MEIPNITRVTGYFSVSHYTKASNVSINTCRNRIKARTIGAINLDGHWFVDVSGTPIDPGYKLNAEEKSKLVNYLPEDVFSLKHVKSFARNKNYRIDRFLEAILIGRIKGVVMDDEVFAYKQELEDLL